MRVTLKLFAAVRDAIGQNEVVIELPEDAKITNVRSALCAMHPQLRFLVERAMFAIDARYAQDDDIVAEGSDVACIPPVSGG
jgi:molybdopterin synthase catalytic subunit